MSEENKPVEGDKKPGLKLVDTENVVSFPEKEDEEAVKRDMSKMLRCLADDIEKGSLPNTSSVGVVVMGDSMDVFGAGIDCEAPTIALLFQAASLRFAAAVEQHGVE